MSCSALQSYVCGILAHVPWIHWAVMGVLSLFLMATLLIRKKCSTYGAIAFGLTVFVGLFLIDTAVVIRYYGLMNHAFGRNLTLDLTRMFQNDGEGPAETLANIAVFVPFGFFLTEYLAASKRFGAWHRIGYAALAAFGLSLCTESLQLILHVGFFELTDLVMNTAGGTVGACLSVLGRKMWGRVTH